jgi:hypothetical protein
MPLEAMVDAAYLMLNQLSKQLEASYSGMDFILII